MTSQRPNPKRTPPICAVKEFERKPAVGKVALIPAELGPLD